MQSARERERLNFLLQEHWAGRGVEKNLPCIPGRLVEVEELDEDAVAGVSVFFFFGGGGFGVA